MQKKTADYVKQTIALANRNGSVSNGEEEADSEKDMPKSPTSDPLVSHLSILRTWRIQKFILRFIRGPLGVHWGSIGGP